LAFADDRGWIIGKHAGHWRQVADVAVDDAEQRDDDAKKSDGCIEKASQHRSKRKTRDFLA
jgi:hypothetical protein